MSFTAKTDACITMSDNTPYTCTCNYRTLDMPRWIPFFYIYLYIVSYTLFVIWKITFLFCNCNCIWRNDLLKYVLPMFIILPLYSIKSCSISRSRKQNVPQYFHFDDISVKIGSLHIFSRCIITVLQSLCDLHHGNWRHDRGFH